MLRAAVGLLVLCLPGARPGAVVVETEHYHLTAETSEAEAREMGRVLEAAWPQWADFFGAEPKRKKGERLSVFFAADRESFAARLRADGVTPPAAGGYYSPGNRTAYLWRQPTVLFTRMLLLHECTHQFHYLAKTGNRALPSTWYVEGLAEYLSRHHWDGETLTLGALPLVSLEDYPAAARERLAGKQVDLARLFDGEVFDRPVSFAILRYLATAEGGKLRGRLERVAAKLDRGTTSAALLARTIGSPARLRPKLLAWLETEQEPFAVVFNSWEGIGPDRIHGWAGAGIVSACRVKGPARRLAATLAVPEKPGWCGGLLLHHEDRANLTVGLVRPGGVFRVDRRRGGKWEVLATGECPAPEGGVLRLEAERAEEGVFCTVGGKRFGPFDLPGETLGLALQGSDLRFRDIGWE